jgi:hypothetical protein
VFAIAAVVWVGTYYLLFHAPRDAYPLLITLVLFWIFGYWSLVGPLLAAITIRKVFRALEQAKTKDDVLRALGSDGGREAAIRLISSENGIPRFLAAQILRLVERRLSANATASTPSSESS